MADYKKSLMKEWLTQDPQPQPVLLLVAGILILMIKPWSISFDDFATTAKREIRFSAFAILLVGIYFSWCIEGWIWKHFFSWSPSSRLYRASQRLDTVVLALCGVVGFVVLFIVGKHQSDVHGRWLY